MANEDPAADAIVAEAREALSQGDFGMARKLLLGLVARTRSAGGALPAEGQALLDRLRPDPFVGFLSAGCLLLFAVVLWLTLR
jgi:hypothetical protein